MYVCTGGVVCVCVCARLWCASYVGGLVFCMYNLSYTVGACHGESSPAPYRAKTHICILWIMAGDTMELNLREWDASWNLSSLTPFIARRHTVTRLTRVFLHISPRAQSGSLRLAHLLWHSNRVLLSLFYDVHVIEMYLILLYTSLISQRHSLLTLTHYNILKSVLNFQWKCVIGIVCA